MEVKLWKLAGKVWVSFRFEEFGYQAPPEVELTPQELEMNMLTEEFEKIDTVRAGRATLQVPYSMARSVPYSVDPPRVASATVRRG